MGQPLTTTAREESAGALACVLRTDPEDRRRWEAAQALGRIGDPAVVPPLLGAITDPEPAVRLCVAEALGRIGGGDSRVAPALCCLLIDADTGVRTAALEALAHLGDAIALPAIRTRAAAERRCPEVRIWVHYTLYALGDVPFPFGEAFRLLRLGSLRTRLSAARALAQIDAPEPLLSRIRHALRAASARERGDGVRAWMASLLAEDGAPSETPQENREWAIAAPCLTYSAGRSEECHAGATQERRPDTA